MKIFRNGSQFEFEENDADVLYVPVEISPPGQNAFVRVQGMIDTGASGILIPKRLLDETPGVFPPGGAEISDTANGSVKEAVTEVDIRLKTSIGEIIFLKGIRASVSNSCEDIVLGMSFLRYFSLLFKNGNLVDLRFDEKSVG